MNVFESLEYRDFIEKASKTRKITYRTLSMAARIHTSYFSRVMVGDAEFSASQLYLIAQEFKLNAVETEYLLKLHQQETSQDPGHKNFAREMVRVFRDEHTKLDKKFGDKPKKLSENELEIYYRELLTARIHIYLTIDKYQQKPALIKSKLGISDAKFEEEMQKLEGLALIKRAKDGSVEPLVRTILLDESNPLSAANHTNYRLDAIQNLSRREPVPGDYHFSAVFSTDEASKLKIKELFKQFIVDARKITSEAAADDQVYHISFDLY